MSRRNLFLLGAGAFALYALTAPSVVNGDGLGYLRPLRWSASPQPAAGHLLYVPLLRLLRWLSGGHTLEAARLVNALAGAGAVVFAQRILSRLAGDARMAWLGAIGLAASWGLWAQAADVETYALSLVALLAAVDQLARWQERPGLAAALLAGGFAALATLFHVENLFFFACLAVWLRARRAHAAAAVGAGAGVVLGAYALVAFAILGKSPAQAWAWFRAAGHGFVYLIRPYNVTDALQGLARSLVHAPYVHEADPAVVIGQLLLGTIALGVLVVPPILRRATLPPLPWAALVAWAAPYAVMAFLFFGTDSERWIFVLPLVWLLFAAARLPALGRVLAGALLAVNLVTAALPGVTEIGPRWRARAVESVLDPGDLVIFPGHDWDEYIGFYDDRYVRVFPLSYYVGVYGVEGGLKKLEDVIAGAEGRGGRIFAVRVLDESPGPRGWEELSLLSLPRERAASWLRQRFVATRLEPIRGVEIFLLERPQKTETALEKPR